MARLSATQIARHAKAAGFRGPALTTAIAVALAESGGDPRINAAGAEDSRGLWQINEVHFGRYDASRLYEPAYNARAAFAISERGSNFGPWTTYRIGAHRQYLDDARRAVSRLGRFGGGTGNRRTGTRTGGAQPRQRRARGTTPWRVPRNGAGRTGRLVVTPAFLTALARKLTGHLAVADEVDRRVRNRTAHLDADRLVVHGDLEGHVRGALRLVEDRRTTRSLPELFSRDLAYVIDAQRRGVAMDARRAFGDRAADRLVGSLPAGTSAATRRRVRRRVRGLEPTALPTTPRRRPNRRPSTGGSGPDRGRERTTGPRSVRLDRRWGGSQAPFEQAITPFLRARGLQPGSQKRTGGDNPNSDHLTAHRTAYAIDYPTYAGLDDARALARHLGIDGWQPNSYQSHTVRFGAARFRVQILWGAAIDHADHVHVGLRRI